MTPARPRQPRPLVVVLPDGQEAGEECDTTIPEDLAGVWHWHGSFLSDGHVGIFTGTFGVAGAFEQARIHMRLRANAEPQQLTLF